MGERFVFTKYRTSCYNCGFTHFYKFNVEYMAKCPLPGEGEGVS